MSAFACQSSEKAEKAEKANRGHFLRRGCGERHYEALSLHGKMATSQKRGLNDARTCHEWSPGYPVLTSTQAILHGIKVRHLCASAGALCL